MTLIVGVKCSDGVVLGADGAATFGNIEGYTIKQPTKKLCLVGSSVIVGFSGAVGLGQFVTVAVDNVWQEMKALTTNSADNLRVKLTAELRKYVMPEIEAAAHAQQLYGLAARGPAQCATLVAMPSFAQSRRAFLFEFDQQCASEEKVEAGSFVAIGSGQRIADPFLAFLKRVFWSTRAPTVADGRFAVVWTLYHTIEVNPGGVALPIQVMTLCDDGHKLVAEPLTDQQIKEHLESTGTAEQVLREFQTAQQETAPPPDIQPPQPPPADIADR